MCTAVSHLTQGLYFGRDLDYEVSFGESVTITPEAFPSGCAIWARWTATTP